MELKMKIHQGTKYTRCGCSPFFQDLPDGWYDMDEIPAPKDTARKKTNQTHRAHAPTRRVVGVPTKKVKVKATGTASRNSRETVKATKYAAEALGVPTSTVEYEDYDFKKLSAKPASQDKLEE